MRSLVCKSVALCSTDHRLGLETCQSTPDQQHKPSVGAGQKISPGNIKVSDKAFKWSGKALHRLSKRSTRPPTTLDLGWFKEFFPTNQVQRGGDANGGDMNVVLFQELLRHSKAQSVMNHFACQCKYGVNH